MSPPLLPPHLLQSQLDTLSLLQAMYPLENELEVPEETLRSVERIAGYLEGTGSAEELKREKALHCVLRVMLEPAGEGHIGLRVGLPLVGESPKPTFGLQLPSELTRADGEDLDAAISKVEYDPDDTLTYISLISETLQQQASLKLQQHRQRALELSNQSGNSDEKRKRKGSLDRIWFWFPSLSTREKRNDLVNYAGRWGLTGFVLAGKPGILCLEGYAADVEEYMAAIKSESWSDIPSYQKKVTERHRSPIPHPTFPTMSEITSQITQRGQHNNRGDMRELREWMEGKGVGEEFGIAVGGIGGLGG